MSSKQALVFGASGVSGWAIFRECLTYPSLSTFSRVVGLTKRPLDKHAFFLSSGAERAEVHSGIDLTENLESVIEKLKAIRSIEQITHVYYAGKLVLLDSP